MTDKCISCDNETNLICHNCELYLCYLCSISCVECKSEICQECFIKCTDCLVDICKYCKMSCDICSIYRLCTSCKYVTHDHDSFKDGNKCSFCDTTPQLNCKNCKINLCHSCSISCVKCASQICTECLMVCNDCSDELCKICFKSCDICGIDSICLYCKYVKHSHIN